MPPGRGGHRREARRADGGDGGSLTVTLSGMQNRRGGVVVVSERAPKEISFEDVSEMGEARFRQLAPGDYSVFAVDHPNHFEFRNPEVLAAYAGRASHVTISANTEATASVELIHVEP